MKVNTNRKQAAAKPPNFC